MDKIHRNKTYNGRNIQNAKSLRKNMTEQERKLWYNYLKDYPVKFYRQRVIDNYIADFYCARAKLVIEIDGSQHYSDNGEEYDQRRTDVLKRYEITVIRFTNPQISYRFREVCMAIDDAVKRLLQV